MIKIVTKDNTTYTVESIRHRENGIMFDYNNDIVFLSNSQIKLIDGSFKPVNAKAYLKNR